MAGTRHRAVGQVSPPRIRSLIRFNRLPAPARRCADLVSQLEGVQRERDRVFADNEALRDRLRDADEWERELLSLRRWRTEAEREHSRRECVHVCALVIVCVCARARV